MYFIFFTYFKTSECLSAIWNNWPLVKITSFVVVLKFIVYFDTLNYPTTM